jgi:hypothetical protein
MLWEECNAPTLRAWISTAGQHDDPTFVVLKVD